jgi:acetyltransferase-like isoleucine patch superfamily enzyme
VAQYRQSIQPVIVIGDHTSVSGFLTITAVESVLIDSKVLIARYVYISDHTHATGSLEHAIKDQGITKAAPVHIREGAWLGQGVVVCPGVTIGRNAVIGANSVVRHDVPDFCVAAGAPARVIRRIDEASSKR